METNGNREIAAVGWSKRTLNPSKVMIYHLLSFLRSMEAIPRVQGTQRAQNPSNPKSCNAAGPEMTRPTVVTKFIVLNVPKLFKSKQYCMNFNENERVKTFYMPLTNAKISKISASVPYADRSIWRCTPVLALRRVW